MKTTAFVLSILVLVIVSLTGCNRQDGGDTYDTTIGADSINADGFNDAFVLEPVCSGLVLTSDLGKRLKWMVVYTNTANYAFDPSGVIPPEYVEVHNLHANTPMISFTASDAQDAARKVCFVIKGKGGRVQ